MRAIVPLRQFVLKVHSRCDLACDHCYVYEHADQSWRGRPRAMSVPTAARTAARIAEHVDAHGITEVCVILHGGEPLLAGRDRLDAIITELRAELGGRCALELRIHTNGVLLDTALCELFRRHGVRVGISLDGDRASNDRHRRYADGRSSYDKVVRAIDLVRHQIPALYAGLLCTIDVRNDPIAVYEALIEHDPPAMDFLLPHATWDEPPYRPVDTAYADWLIRIFDRWQADGMRVPVRIFDSIIRTGRGAGSLTESLGLEPSDLVVVETDGTLEQADSLKTAYDGAPATGYDVFACTLDEVARHPGIMARQDGVDGLCATCRECPVVSSCGGGLYAHRFRTGSGFANPSVYCADLMKLITHVRRHATLPVHAVPAAELDELAAGYGGAEAIGALNEAQRTLRRALLAAIPDDAATQPAWDVLAKVDQEDPGALDSVLAHPYVRLWAVECLHGRAATKYLIAVAAVSAIRAGTTARLDLPVLRGAVHLPTLGVWSVAGAQKTETVRIDIADGAYTLPGTGEPQRVRRLTAPGIDVALDDVDPYRDCYQWPAASRLGDQEVAAWQRMFHEAWELIERDHPAYLSGLRAGLSTIVPLAAAGAEQEVGSTARQAYGAIAIALPAEPDALARLLIQEFQYMKLGAVLDLFDLYDDEADDGRYPVPWHDDPIPLEGLLLGTYRHLAVTDYWRTRRTVTTGPAQAAATAAFARLRAQTATGIETLTGSGALTELGVRFVAGMQATAAPWLNDPLPAAGFAKAAEPAGPHRITGQERSPTGSR